MLSRLGGGVGSTRFIRPWGRPPLALRQGILLKFWVTAPAQMKVALGVSLSNNNTQKKEINMSKVVVGMTMSLDGFVNDSSGSVASLYPDFESFRETELLGYLKILALHLFNWKD
jgi:hypothetical protein